LYGFAKFGFQPWRYINYLNGIDAQELFQSGANTQSWSIETWAALSGDALLSWEDWLYDPNTEADIFGQTGTQQTGSLITGSSSSESFGFIKNSDNSGSSVNSNTDKAITTTSSASTWDARSQLLNLIKSKEK
jgi:hypothetical protein